MSDQYRKKPIVIEAFQMTEERGTDNSEWPEWLHSAWNYAPGLLGSLYLEPGTGLEPPTRRFLIGTLEGPLRVTWGDWIIRGIHHELYPCKPDVFAATYEAVEP